MKIITRWSESSIKKFVTGLRRKKKKIIFTNGVFDILHYGHIDFLTKAGALGDVLIVGLNTDSSARKFKSRGRPVQNEKDRAKILAALEMVDYVVLFSEETPERLITAVRPDVLVKGADYKIFQIVGADLVKSYGGKVKRIRLAKGRSTTSIIRKIKRL